MLQRVFVDADVLAARTPFEWLALLCDETEDWFQLHSTSGAVAEAVLLWTAEDPARREGWSGRRHDLLVASLDEVLATPAGRSEADPADAAAAGGAHVLLSSRAGEVAGGDELPFEVYTVDEFLCLLDDTAAAHVRRVTERQQDRHHAGAASRGLVESLTGAGCPAFAERVSRHLR
ncbi:MULTISPECIES: hypothetical protein [Microbacterium]|uniref:hypothetical protein n=1 Tax=Microbacterium TaxID=33882 RepID=UPI000D64B737|nr:MULTISPECIES: hypothetical protein [Microbacterium]